MILDENLIDLQSDIKLTDKEVFTKIWFKPRMVFKFINDNYYEKYFIVLLVLAGISNAFSRSFNKSLGDDLSLTALLAVCIFLGGLFGWIGYYFYAALLSWTGKWLNGKGNTNTFLRMSAYASLPTIFVLILLIPQLILFGDTLFKSDIDIYNNGLFTVIVYYIIALFELIMGIWSIVFFIIGISEVQKFSIGKSILNLILPILIIIVPIMLIAFLVAGN